MRAERLISVLMALQRSQALTAGELARRLEVSVRTIFRDIDALSAMGVPVYTEPGRNGGIRLMEGYSSDLTGLSSGEAEALALIASPALVGVREIDAPARRALDKLAAAVPSMHQLRAQHARNRLLFDTKKWFSARDASPHLDRLRELVWKSECIRIAYRRSDGELRDYDVAPYALVVKIDTWYLIGRVKDEMRVFRLSRLQSIEAIGKAFEREKGFDLTKFWTGWCERFEKNPPNSFLVELAVTEAGEKRLRDHWCDWIRESDASRVRDRETLTVDLQLEDIALRVLFELGAEARVLTPVTLKKKLHAMAKEVVRASR